MSSVRRRGRDCCTPPPGAPASKSRRDKLTPEQRSVLAELGVDRAQGR
ncbi:hypothetical protein [Streptomyces sp. NPDC051994]